MRAQHTPGPWKIQSPSHPDINQREDKLIYAKSGDEFLHIAEVYQYQNDNNHEANGTAPANARLIAAAPEMLDLFRELLNEVEEYANIAKPPVSNRLNGKTNKARALISRIEGGE